MTIRNLRYDELSGFGKMTQYKAMKNVADKLNEVLGTNIDIFNNDDWVLVNNLISEKDVRFNSYGDIDIPLLI